MRVLLIVLTGLLLFFTVFFICRRLLALAAVIFDSHIRFRHGQREALAQGRQDRRYMPLSVLLMAGTDPQALLTTLESLKKQTYPLVEILILEDSMDDAAVQALAEQLELLPLPQPVRRQLKCASENAIYENCVEKIRLIRKPKTCLGDAWNLGVNIARYPYFACIQAGMRLPADSLEKLMGPFFQYGDTVATGGTVQSENAALHPTLSILENLEFDRSVPALQTLLQRRTPLLCGGPTVYRKDAVIEAGGFPALDNGMDASVSLSLQRLFRKEKRLCRIVYLPEAAVYMPPSASMSQLLQQRCRWQQGMKAAMRSAAEMLCLPRYGAVGLQYLLFLIFSLWAPLLSTLGAITVLVCLGLGMLDGMLLLQILILSLLFKLLLSISAFRNRTESFSLSPGQIPVFLLLWLAESTLYRLCITLARIRGLFT